MAQTTPEEVRRTKKAARPPRPIPEPDSDFYSLEETLAPDEAKILQKVRAFMDEKVAPIITKYWAEDAFPFELLPAVRQLGIGGVGFHGYGCPGGSPLLAGFIWMEMARVDASFCTFFGVHSGLSMGSVYLGGSEEQKQRWLPPMARLELVGAFGLTEPEVGSGASRGMQTTAKREGDGWVLNGEKKWIGNSPWCDLTIIWAKDVADDQVKGFIVENKTAPGFRVEKIQHKLSLRVVQNGHIIMKDCRVPEANRLQGDASFRDTARVLRMTRSGVAWMATGVQMGAYEHALRYCQHRLQFGRPIASFQMIQEHLARMLANITASQCMCVQLARMQQEGKLEDQHASLAKAYTTVAMRDTVARAREVLGANGILLDEQVARFFADAEAIYSYEGTREMQTLIVGRAITGFSAFV
ncbi:MAG TPA: acyl-CoA dehydrogenase family protein [Polyangiaceae bacterium]|nr:acyl-CoA dehydrogenase family protein [Polyangiaceae bacterium]